jgi:hypothetical protein
MADTPPTFTLDARDIHAPALLKALAAKHRGTNPQHAELIDKMADGFAAWKRRNPNAR